MKKKVTAIILTLVMIIAACASLAACSGNGGGQGGGEQPAAKGVTIAVPNDTTNEARALMLLESLGYIKLKEGAGTRYNPDFVALISDDSELYNEINDLLSVNRENYYFDLVKIHLQSQK